MRPCALCCVLVALWARLATCSVWSCCNGDWFDPNCWDYMPGSSDDAQFQLASNCNVTFSNASVTVRSITLSLSNSAPIPSSPLQLWFVKASSLQDKPSLTVQTITVGNYIALTALALNIAASQQVTTSFQSQLVCYGSNIGSSSCASCAPTGTLTVAGHSTFLLKPLSALDTVYLTMNIKNSGSMQINGGQNVYMSGNLVNSNKLYLQISNFIPAAYSGWKNDVTGTITFSNDGSSTKYYMRFMSAFNNSGTVQIDAPCTVVFAGGGTNTGMLGVDGSLNVTNSYNFVSNTMQGSGSVYLQSINSVLLAGSCGSSIKLFVDGPTTIAQLFQVKAGCTVTMGATDLFAGSLKGAGVSASSISVLNGGVFGSDGSTACTISSLTLSNAGNVALLSMAFGSQSIISNQAQGIVRLTETRLQDQASSLLLTNAGELVMTASAFSSVQNSGRVIIIQSSSLSLALSSTASFMQQSGVVATIVNNAMSASVRVAASPGYGWSPSFTLSGYAELDLLPGTSWILLSPNISVCSLEMKNVVQASMADSTHGCDVSFSYTSLKCVGECTFLGAISIANTSTFLGNGTVISHSFSFGPVAAGQELVSEASFRNVGSCVACGGVLSLQGGFVQIGAAAELNLCGGQLLGNVSIVQGSLFPGGSIVGDVDLGGRLTFGENMILNVVGSFRSTSTSLISLSFELTNSATAGLIATRSNLLNVTQALELSGRVSSNWTWIGPPSLNLSSPILFLAASSLTALTRGELAVEIRQFDPQTLLPLFTDKQMLFVFQGCPDGTTGTYMCDGCSPGTFSRRNGFAPLQCESCPPGSYQVKTRRSLPPASLLLADFAPCSPALVREAAARACKGSIRTGPGHFSVSSVQQGMCRPARARLRVRLVLQARTQILVRFTVFPVQQDIIMLQQEFAYQMFRRVWSINLKSSISIRLSS